MWGKTKKGSESVRYNLCKSLLVEPLSAALWRKCAIHFLSSFFLSLKCMVTWMCTKHNCTFEIHVSHQKRRTCERSLLTAFHRWGFHVADTWGSSLFLDLRSEPLISGKADRRWACSDSATCASPCLCLCACVWVGRQLPAAIRIDGGKTLSQPWWWLIQPVLQKRTNTHIWITCCLACFPAASTS